MIDILLFIALFAGTLFIFGSWLAFIVFLLSYTITLGHWENEQYRQPLVISTICTIVATAIMIYVRTF